MGSTYKSSEQLERMAKMLNENNEAFQEAVRKDFKTLNQRTDMRLLRNSMLGPSSPLVQILNCQQSDPKHGI
jgi:hypothetical protein